MSPPKDGGSLDDLEKKLYKKDTEFSYKRQTLSQKEVDAPHEWSDVPRKKVRRTFSSFILDTSLLMKLFYLSLFFFFAAASISAYFIWIQPRIYSPDNIDILVKAPTSVTGGESVPFQFIITNKNDVTLESSDLSISFPEGIFVAGDNTRADRYVKNIGALLPGQSITETVPLIFYGEENTEKSFVMELEYRVENATFTKEKTHTVALTSSPVALSVSIPDEVNAGETFAIQVTATSNTNETIKDLMVTLEYPFGYSFAGAEPAPYDGNNVWYIGDLAPQEQREILIEGEVEGEPKQQRTFKVLIGTQDTEDSDKIGVLYNSFSQTVPIAEPFLAIDFAINGSRAAQEVVAQSGNTINVNINWENKTSSRIINGALELAVNGAVVDRASIAPNKGFYSSRDDTVIWNQTTDRSLALIEPGDNGQMSLTMKTRSLFSAGGSQYRNPAITLSLTFTGERVSPGFPTEVITLTSEKVIKVATALQLDSYAVYSESSDNPFTNSGPIPPEVEKPTTYTVIWSVVNSSNNVSGAEVRASLPLYVKWLGNVSPQGEDVRFNDVTGEVVWNVGDVPAGAGSSKKVAFQVELVPSVTQVNQSPTILYETTLSGTDTFTRTQVTDVERSLSTAISRDPVYGGEAAAAQVTN